MNGINARHGLIAWAVAAIAAGSALAQPAAGPPGAPAQQSWRIGGKAGLLLGGTVNVDTGVFSGDFDTDGGFMLLLTGDSITGPKLALGGFIFVARGEDEFNEDFNVTTLGGTVKTRLGGDIQVRPGLALGYQIISSDQDPDDSSGLDIGGFVEIAKPMQQGYELLFEIGFITQPAGGNDNVDLTFGPHFYIAVGAGIGR